MVRNPGIFRPAAGALTTASVLGGAALVGTVAGARYNEGAGAETAGSDAP